MAENNKRIGLIDGIRGFSLLGILLANLLIFQYGEFGMFDAAYFNLSKNDQIFYTLTKIFIEYSFMPIFAFIFGYSLILMKQSLERKELKVKSHLFNRSIVLIGFGILHIVFLWEGDILAIYGAITILLLFFVNRKPTTLLIWGGIIFTMFFLLSFMGISLLEPLDLLEPKIKEAYLMDLVEVHTNGSYGEIMYFRNEIEPPIVMDAWQQSMQFVLLLIVYLPMFLLGMYAAHRKVLIPSKKRKTLYLLAAVTLIPIGLALKSVMYFDVTFAFTEFGGTVLAIGYIGLFAYLYTIFAKSKITTAFENVGKLSLTNYILQTVICTFIFYGYGLGYFAEMGVTKAFFLGLIIFMMQVIASTLYLKYFKQGPLEKLLRTLVYLKLPKRIK